MAARQLILVLVSAWVLLADAPPVTPQTLSLPYVRDFVWDATRSRIFASAGSSIVMINPETAQVEDTITSGQVSSRIAVSDDGQYLYAVVDARNIIQRYRLPDHAPDLEISLGRDSQGKGFTAATMVTLPGQPRSLLVSRGLAVASMDFDFYTRTGQDVVVYDGAVPRPDTVTPGVASFYVRPSDRSIHGWAPGRVFRYTVKPTGVAINRSVLTPVGFSGNAFPTWNAGLLADRGGTIYDLESGTFLGRAAIVGGCSLGPDQSGKAILAAQGQRYNSYVPERLVQYSTGTFLTTAAASVKAGTDYMGACDPISVIRTWGSDGIAISSFQHTDVEHGSKLVLFHSGELSPETLEPAPAPQTDASGVIRLPIAANDLVFDNSRNLLWASVPGKTGQIGNTLISIEPATGKIVDTIFAGSEPGKLALSSDASRIFSILQSVPSISTVDLDTKERVQVFSVLDTKTWSPVSLATVPEQNNTIAVVRTTMDPAYASNVSIYDSGVPRPKSVSNIMADTSANVIQRLTAIFPGDVRDSFYGVDLETNDGTGKHRISRLVLDADGIGLDKWLNPLALYNNRLGGKLVYDNGMLFTSGGEIVTPDAKILLRRFAQRSVNNVDVRIPIPLSDLQQLAVVSVSTATNAASLTLLDLETCRPMFSMEVVSRDDQPPQTVAAMRAGAGIIAVLAGGQIVLVPLSSLPAWPKFGRDPQVVGTGIQRMDLPANAVAGVPGTSRLAIATPSSAGDLGNSVVILDPSTGQIEANVFAGSEPTLLAASPDGSAIYATLAGEQRVAKIDVASRTRSLIFPPDPKGGTNQTQVYDCAVLGDGGLAVSYFGGAIAVFDNDRPRPVVDWNTQGPFAYAPASFKLAWNEAGSRIYGYNAGSPDSQVKRSGLTWQGVQWLSTADNVIGGDSGQLKSSQGLIYTGRGDVIDPERSRRVGKFALPENRYSSLVELDRAAGRVFLMGGMEIFMFDWDSHALLGSLEIPVNSPESAMSLVRYGDDGLAFHTTAGRLYLVRVSAIPLLAKPVPSVQPSLPVTRGVTVIDLASKDIAYDPARNLLYASVPNREAARGDQIASIDPEEGKITGTITAVSEPRLLALADDQSRLYFTSGLTNNEDQAGLSATPEIIRGLDLDTGNVSSGIPPRTPPADSWYEWLDLVVLPGQPRSIVTLDFLYQAVLIRGGILQVGIGPDSLRVFDDALSRPSFLSRPTLSCTSLVVASTARLYCSGGYTNDFLRLAVDDKGITVLSSFRLAPGKVAYGMAFGNGRVYMTSGVVLDPETGTEIARLDVQGPVAIDGNTVYWLDTSTSTWDKPNVLTLRAFDTVTLQPVSSRQINTSTSPGLTRLIRCGQGRLAFRAGNEIYIVNPE